MVHVSSILSLYHMEKVYRNSIHVQVFVVKYCTLDSQKNIHLRRCTNCWKTGHTKSTCKKDSCCKVCQKPGHLPGQKEYPHYEIQKHIAPFSGSQDVLSNFYPCELEIYGVKHKSAEHAFQYTKAIRCDLEAASKITVAEDVLSAMRLGKQSKRTSN